MITRYDLGREYAHQIGAPATTEQPDGRYVLFADHQHETELLRIEIDFWRHRTMRAEQVDVAALQAGLGESNER